LKERKKESNRKNKERREEKANRKVMFKYIVFFFLAQEVPN
jgi:cell division septal protein FtsQ